MAALTFEALPTRHETITLPIILDMSESEFHDAELVMKTGPQQQHPPALEPTDGPAKYMIYSTEEFLDMPTVRCTQLIPIPVLRKFKLWSSCKITAVNGTRLAPVFMDNQIKSEHAHMFNFYYI